MLPFKSFSKKQKFLLSWWTNPSINNFDGIICDGAIRSGKTSCMSLSFVFWSMSCFNNQSFALCGKTIDSLKRNLITPLISILANLGISVSFKNSKNYLDISLGNNTNRFYLFSGHDESSFSSIQGITLAGVLLDEVVLMPRSFVNQALARCSVEGAKFWFNCNPESPHHWFFKEWISNHKSKNILYIHFTMEDNPSLSQQVIKRYHSLYSGSFYNRYILGQWSAVEGRIYSMFDYNTHVIDNIPHCDSFWISCDYGTVNPFSIGLWGVNHENSFFRISEMYHDSKSSGNHKTDEQYYSLLTSLAANYPIQKIIIDPSASSFIQCIKHHGHFRVEIAKNNVVQGINAVADRLNNKTIFFHKSCLDSIREFDIYKWNSNSDKDVPIKEYDHAMDDIRYFVMSQTNYSQNSSFAFLSQSRT